MRLFSFRTVALTLAAFLGGCPTVLTCEEGFMFSAGTCVPRDGGTGVDGGPADAPGVDAPDAPMVDAGPCGMPCTAPTPFCDETAMMCVECRTSTDCSAPTPACVDGACEECDDNMDCDAVDASACDTTTNMCEGCAADGDCTHLTATPVCNEATMTCVACTADAEGLCGTNVCNVAAGTCTTTPAGSVGVCLPCTSDRACATGTACVLQRFDEPPIGGTVTDVGYFCLPAGTTCPLSGAPFMSAVSLTNVAGDATMVCDLTLATCTGYTDYRTTTCTTDAECGAAGLDDALCRTRAGVGMQCTTRCLGSEDCRSGAGCSTGAPPSYCCFGATCT